MGIAPAFASVSEALDMVQAGLSYLAAADAAQLPAATQAECLRRLERSDAIATAARAFILAGFAAGQGYADDADYSAVAWLIHQTRITRGAAVGHAAWARRTGTHPTVLRERVSSPGGTTVAALRQLDDHKVRAAFISAIEAAAQRSHELAAGNP